MIEANFSCPNVGAGQGALYTDAGAVAALTSALVTALGPRTPLLIKVQGLAERERGMQHTPAVAVLLSALFQLSTPSHMPSHSSRTCTSLSPHLHRWGPSLTPPCWSRCWWRQRPRGRQAWQASTGSAGVDAWQCTHACGAPALLLHPPGLPGLPA